ncbi:sugar phosphate isomerase/epimerase family protein [Fimbriiglobus ruber]|uniref:Inosose isomerase n=1 Tax=Fimbriiglobus ruber TaxID=1908690 RepID=A0A225DMT9_9BACT|nr:sugar phosphate isomerase/epimerase [Fimbriiglobus ruber]OWK42333.1 Inosose isomerase [Fimbriiglobus ruber]
MQLGFVSAILGDLTLEEVFAFAADEGFPCVEVMCWPPGKADRRYAGVTHLDVSEFTHDAAAHVHDLMRIHRVQISGLGYYPNPLDPDPAHRRVVGEHLKKVIRAAPAVGVGVVNTFIGRDWRQSVAANMSLVREVWTPILAEAATAGVKIGIEHCPMLFSDDEWPGGKNVAVSPAVWRQLFDLFPDGRLGLNFDPSHLIWQFIDAARAVREFGPHIVHVHAKDERIDHERLYEVGAMGLGWHRPKLPGLGDVAWGPFFAALTDSGYNGPVCIEVEDRAYEGSLADRRRALRQSKKFLEQFCG